MPDDHIQGKDELLCVSVLPYFTIDLGSQGNARPGVEGICNHGAHRTKGIEALGPAPLSIFILQVAGSEIVNAGVAENVAANIFINRNVATVLANHNPKLSLVIGTLGDPRPHYVSSWIKDGRRRLEEDQGFDWYFMPEFVGMLPVITADTYDVGWVYGRKQVCLVQGNRLGASARHVLQLAASLMGRLQQNAGNKFAACNLLN